MLEVGVHASGGDEAEQVHGTAPRRRPAERAAKHLVLQEGAVADGGVHALQVLEEDAAGADREMAHLRVAHLSVREPDGLPGGPQLRVRIACAELVEDGCARQLDCVSRPGRGDTPSVQDDERYEREPARQIAAKLSGSREAPPTSAPSTSGWPSSSSALSGLTEPP